MPIPVKCDCGRALRLKDELAGKKIRCPGCSAVVMVPQSDAPTDAEDEALNLLMEAPDEPAPRSRYVPDDPPPATDAVQPPPRPSPPAFRKPEPPKPAVKRKPARKS